MADAPSNKIYRGLRLNDIPEELQAIIKDSLGLPMDESEVGKHFRLGPALLDHIEGNHWEKDDPYYADHGLETANMGRNWTTNRDFAEKAGSPNTGPCQYGVLLEADLPTNPYAFDSTNNGEYEGNMRSEQQVTPVPGAPLNVTGVKILDGQEWREVLNDPEYVARRSKEYPSIAEHHTGPQIRIALNAPGFDADYALQRWEDTGNFFFAYSPTINVRTAMAWDEWAPKIKGGCEECRYGPGEGVLDPKTNVWKYPPVAEGRYIIPQAGAHLTFSHGTYMGKPALNVIGIYTHPQNRNDGVAEALMRKLVDDHPDVRINPGLMTSDGQHFHDRMLEKDPQAKDLVTTLHYAMAWQDWKDKIVRQTSDGYPDDGFCGRDCSSFDWRHDGRDMRYQIDHENGAWSALDYGHYADSHGTPYVAVHMIRTSPDYRNDGVAEALMRKLVDDHPGVRIDPGDMTEDGQAFHDRMLKKEPAARELVTAAQSLLVGPQDAYDELDWFIRRDKHPPVNADPSLEDWYHVSPHRIPEGTTLAPMRGQTPWSDEPYDHGLQNRVNWIWVEHDKNKARGWMRYILQHQPEAFIYRVQPDLGPFAWNGTADEGWVTNRAVVVEFLDKVTQDLSFQEKAL